MPYDCITNACLTLYDNTNVSSTLLKDLVAYLCKILLTIW